MLLFACEAHASKQKADTAAWNGTLIVKQLQGIGSAPAVPALVATVRRLVQMEGMVRVEVVVKVVVSPIHSHILLLLLAPAMAESM